MTLRNTLAPIPFELSETPLEFSIPDFGLQLPETLTSPIQGSRFSLRRYAEALEDVEVLYSILQDPRLWEGGYNFSGREVDLNDTEDIRDSMIGRWVNVDSDLMAILDGDTFIGITGVVNWDFNNSSFGIPSGIMPKSVLTGRTVLSPNYWGTTANAESKLMIFTEVFSKPVMDVNVSISATNYRSIEATKKFGFELTALSSGLVEDEVKDFQLFTLSRDKWPEARDRNLATIRAKYEAKWLAGI